MLFEKGKPKTGGRKSGVTNKRTALLKDAILTAAEKAGGGDMVAYLAEQAKENPVAFLGLLGRVLPLQLQSDRDNPGVITEVRHIIVDTREQADMIELSALTNGTKEPN